MQNTPKYPLDTFAFLCSVSFDYTSICSGFLQLAMLFLVQKPERDAYNEGVKAINWKQPNVFII